MSGPPYPSLVMEHGRAPRNVGPLPEATHDARCSNPLCGDRLELRLRVEDEIIVSARFEAKGCALAKGSASLMTLVVEGQAPTSARRLGQALAQALRGDETGLRAASHSPELEALAELRSLPARLRCVMLPWEALERAFAAGP